MILCQSMVKRGHSGKSQDAKFSPPSNKVMKSETLADIGTYLVELDSRPSAPSPAMPFCRACKRHFVSEQHDID